MSGEKKRPKLRVIQGGRGLDKGRKSGQEQAKKVVRLVEGHKARQQQINQDNWNKIRRFLARRCPQLAGELVKVTHAFVRHEHEAEREVNAVLKRCWFYWRRDGYDSARSYLIYEINVIRMLLGQNLLTGVRDCRDLGGVSA